MSGNPVVVVAAGRARALLGPLPRRLAHTRGVARQATRVMVALPAAERSVLVAAAWLHDVGYAPALAGAADATGLHPLDGARWVADQRWPAPAGGRLWHAGDRRIDGCGLTVRLAGLVAHHTGALIEAALRGLGEALAVFPREDSPVADLLSYCDLTTSPDGAPVAVEARIKEVVSRYGDGHVVSRAIRSADSPVPAQVERARRMLRAAGVEDCEPGGTRLAGA